MPTVSSEPIAQEVMPAQKNTSGGFRRVATLNINTTLAILKGEWKNAQEFNTRALAESPRDVAALGDGVLVNLHQGNLEESIEYIKHVLKVVPDVAARGALEHAYAAAAIPLHSFARKMPDLHKLPFDKLRANGFLYLRSW